MIANRSKFAAAVTLAEVMVAVAILTIAALGALSYEYHAARHAQIARAHIAATRTAQLLLEDWKSTGGSQEYDPTRLQLGFSSGLTIPSDFRDGRGLGSILGGAVHAITVDKLPMLVMLVWKDVAHDTAAEVKLRQLAAVVGFGNPPGNEPAHWLESIEPITLVTYARVDASDG